jgi:hypothetical protein
VEVFMMNRPCVVLALCLTASVSYADTPAPPQRGWTTSTPPPAATPDVWVTLYSGIAKMNGVTVTDDEVRRALTPLPRTGSDSAFRALTAKVKAPEIDTGYVYGIDFADIDNDGQREYVLWDISSGFLRAGEIAGVYRPQAGGAMVAVPVPSMPAFHTDNPAMFDDVGRPYVPGVSPFLSVDREGVTMRYVEGMNAARRRARYLWKGGIIRMLDHVPCTDRACNIPTSFAG